METKTAKQIRKTPFMQGRQVQFDKDSLVNVIGYNNKIKISSAGRQYSKLLRKIEPVFGNIVW